MKPKKAGELTDAPLEDDVLHGGDESEAEDDGDAQRSLIRPEKYDIQGCKLFGKPGLYTAGIAYWDKEQATVE